MEKVTPLSEIFSQRKFFSRGVLNFFGSKFFPKKKGLMGLKILIKGGVGGGEFGSKLFRHPLLRIAERGTAGAYLCLIRMAARVGGAANEGRTYRLHFRVRAFYLFCGAGQDLFSAAGQVQAF